MLTDLIAEIKRCLKETLTELIFQKRNGRNRLDANTKVNHNKRLSASNNLRQKNRWFTRQD